MKVLLTLSQPKFCIYPLYKASKVPICRRIVDFTSGTCTWSYIFALIFSWSYGQSSHQMFVSNQKIVFTLGAISPYQNMVLGSCLKIPIMIGDLNVRSIIRTISFPSCCLLQRRCWNISNMLFLLRSLLKRRS